MRQLFKPCTMYWVHITLTFVLLLSISVASHQKSFAAKTQKLNVVVTTSMIADAVRQVGGEKVSVTALMGPGVDPHAYRQTRSDIAKLVKADLVLWHGLYLEAQLEEFFEKLKAQKKVVALADRLTKSVLLAHDDYKDKFDPHIWMNPDLWAKLMTHVRDVLTEAAPAHKSLFVKNAKAYSAEISELSEYAKKVLSTVPKERRVLISAHDAFNYFGNAFDFEVIGIQGISTESEAGLRRVETLVGLIIERKIPAVFIETSVADRNVKALIEGAQAKGHQVAIGGELFSDAMGKPGTYEGTYIGMIDHNVTLVARALGGEAPAQGMKGRLGVGN